MFRKEIRWIALAVSPEALEMNQPEIKFIAGRKLLLLRTTAGYFAIEEKCPHNGFSLINGRITEDGISIVCPLHRYAFNLGTGRCTHSSGGAARVFPVELREGKLFIGVEETRWGF